MLQGLGLLRCWPLCALLATHLSASTPTPTVARRSVSTAGLARQNAGAPLLWAGLTPGHHSVGCRRLGDSTATVHVWYPAVPGGRPRTFGGYLDSDSVHVREFITRAGVASATVDRLIGAPLFGVAAAEPEIQRAPWILVAQGNDQDAADQVVLCEYLASHGYIVATTPSPTRRAPLEREGQVGEFAEAQASDLQHAASSVAAVLLVNSTRIGVIGHSFRARSGLLLAMRDSRVRALISLDGGIGTATALDAYRKSPSFRAAAVLPPILHFFETLDAVMTPDFTLLHSLHSGGLTLRPTHGMHHAHFTTC